jgi:molybdopterin converting factor small subunit
MTDSTITVSVGYFAVLRDDRGLGAEYVETQAGTVLDLYLELKQKHRLRLNPNQLKFAVNDHFVPGGNALRDGDNVVFIPPVAGG